MKEFIHTDFPEPVEPAMSKCGIFARSAVIISPEISFPRTTVSLLFEDVNLLDEINSLIFTTLTTLLGISTPTAAFPGMGASIRTPEEAKFKAISSERVVILLIFTPEAGCNS